MTADPLDLLAALLRYPDAAVRRDAPALLDALAGTGGSRAGAVAPLADAFARLSGGELEESYARTFDMSPDASLDVGWHLYGEDYSRGAFLVRVRALLRRCRVPERAELPDHLTLLLPLLARLDGEEGEDLACGAVLPALRKVLEAIEDGASPWRSVLVAARDDLVRRFGPARPVPAPTGEKGLRPYDAKPATLASEIPVWRW